MHKQDSFLNLKAYRHPRYLCQMEFAILKVFAVMMAVVTFSSAKASQENTCNACHCQFDNVQVLAQLIKAEVATALKNETGISSGNGVTYKIWGKTSCPTANGAELLYAGRAGGTLFSNRGGGVEKLCLPDNPDYLNGTAGHTGAAFVYGAEYEFSGLNANIEEHNVPCAVCYVSTRAIAVMIPAKTECPSSWTREYYGYLTSEHDNSQGRSSFTCVDVQPEVVPGTSANTNGALFYYSYSKCNSGLPCPPYEDNRILSCVVCTK